MHDAFLLHLRGPLQSYADTGFGPIREAGPFPSRSAVLGLVAAALGLPRLDPRLVDLHDALCVHMATVRDGEMRTDFHTVDAGGKNKTVTYRDYHHDAYFLALVEARTVSHEGTLREARDALTRPVYVPYLGRRSCAPSVPLLPHSPNGADPIEALIQAVKAARAGSHRPFQDIYLYLDAELSEPKIRAAAPGFARVAVSHGERRDRLVQPRRIYAGRPYTAVHLIPSQPAADDPQQAYFDAAS